MKCSTVLAAVLLLGVVLCASAERMSTRDEDPLEDDLADRASLLFRAMDKNRDRFIDAEDAKNSQEQLELHMPGISSDDFAEFIQVADKNGDSKLSRSELFQGLADGITQNDGAEEAPESLVETGATMRLAKKGLGGVLKGAAGLAGRAAGAALRGGLNALMGKKKKGGKKGGKKQDSCVMCQYIVERLESNVKQSGVIPAMSQAQGASFLEIASSEPGMEGMPPMETPIDPAMNSNSIETPEIQIGSPADAAGPTEMPAIALVDDNEQSPIVMLETEQLYLDQTAAGIIGSTRQSTRVQRQLERQKYNEIYRVVDITLDDVCEQGMPNAFYGFCKMVYKVQSDIVDGLRYQYRPTDICFRVGMCAKGSYITKGIHSRYK